ncbi:MAG: hypothetical protein AABY22_02900, partial [Nanoarchaeota archaeon]
MNTEKTNSANNKSESDSTVKPDVTKPCPQAEDMAKAKLEQIRGKNIDLWVDGEQSEYWKEIYSMGVNDERVRASSNVDNIKPQEDMKEFILSEYKKGNIVASTFEGLQVAPLKEIIKQPVDGLLYDLNRNESVVLTFINDPKW